jgi:hypothetical protein
LGDCEGTLERARPSTNAATSGVNRASNANVGPGDPGEGTLAVAISDAGGAAVSVFGALAEGADAVTLFGASEVGLAGVVVGASRSVTGCNDTSAVVRTFAVVCDTS